MRRLTHYLDELGFNLVGYGCTTCIGNSGPVDADVAAAVNQGGLVAAAVLSGNRNFEGRSEPVVRANYLASPPLVVAYALAGHMDFDPMTEPPARDQDGNAVMLADLWPSQTAIEASMRDAVRSEMFREQYGSVFEGDPAWRTLEAPEGSRYRWDDGSTYVKNPPYFENLAEEPGELEDIDGARVLVMVGDSVTTDHISPAGSIAPDSPAAAYLFDRDIKRGGLQLLRRASRQPRGDDARHVREHPPAQPARAGDGGGRDASPAGRRGTEHLRCGRGPTGRRVCP